MSPAKAEHAAAQLARPVDLTDDALRLLEWTRDTGDLGARFTVSPALCEYLGLTIAELIRAAQTVRASTYAGAFRPTKRVSIPDRVRQTVYARDGHTCRLCPATSPLTLDHHPVPYARGGSDHITNLRTLCDPCNGAEGSQEGTDRHD